MGVIPYEYLTFNGKNSGDYGIWISGGGTFNAPARDVSFTAVPGRNGDLLFDNDRFNNIKVTYPAFITRRFSPRIEEMRAFFSSQRGYKRLEDSYHPGEYRMAAYVSGLEVETVQRNIAGRFDLTFNCKPQRYLKAGEIPLPDFTAAGVIFNPTQFSAKPLVRCYGSAGSVTLNGVTVAITDISGYADMDCELMEVIGYNKQTTLTDGEFPVLAPGENSLSFTGFSKVVITPRWFTI